MHLSDVQIQKLCDRLSSEGRILAGYLLGSVVRGHFRDDSDMDLAVLLGPGRRMDLMARLELAADLSQVAGRTVDVGLLSTQNLIYAKEAIISGRCIYCRDTGARDLFAATALAMYLQLKRERREIEKAYIDE